MTTLNHDPITFGFSIGVVLALLAIVGIVAWLAYASIRGRLLFRFEYYSSFVGNLGNLGRHVFLPHAHHFRRLNLFLCIVQIMILRFNAPIFASLVRPS